MSNIKKAEIKRQLENTFVNVRDTKDCIRVNIPELSKDNLTFINNVIGSDGFIYRIKRSGTGLVLIISLRV